jgi:molybdopterin converting factor small subunit
MNLTGQNRHLISVMHVEFFGISRQRAGVAELKMHAKSLGQLLSTLASTIPPLNDVIDGRSLHPSFVANLNGERFINDPETPLDENDSVLILSADAGG